MEPTRPAEAVADGALDPFHPLVRSWFAERVGTPTDVQRRAWPVISAGEHVLVTAPTGSGKTLTAFLWAIDRLLTGAVAGGAPRILYVSPLKALNADVGRNLEQPLAELTRRFEAAGEQPPAVRVHIRSGDTPQSERRKALRRPPEILITTPESLNILLTSEGGRSLLGGLETVILDEVHAVAGSKRGTHLATAVERLVLLSGEFQRIALSATVRPLERVARFVGGATLEHRGGAASYRERPVRTIRSGDEKVYAVEVRFPEEPEAAASDGGAVDGGATTDDPGAEEASVWDRLVPLFRRRIAANRSTLLFANSRRLTEKITRLVNEEAGETVAYAHHGSLSREVRSVVEARLERGELPAIVATSSLELGIDIGALDEVVLVQTPPTVASAIQRVGRSGHRVGEVSRGLLVPTHGRDFLDAAVMARSILDGAIEEVRPVEAPLDVLAQVILSLTVADVWTVDELYDFLRTASPYRDLPRRHFELVLDMLAGRFADSRIRELRPRVVLDRLDGTVRARRGVPRLLYLSGGTIPDRGYFHLREARTMGRLGELDEEFVWERSVGDTFTLGTQGWRIVQITHNDVLVEPAFRAGALAPFWRSDEEDRGHHLSGRIAEFLEAIEPVVEEADLAERLADGWSCDVGAARALARLLREQKAALGGRLPHRHRLVAERVASGEGLGGGPRPVGPDRQRLILHTLWGGRVNRPLALALAAAWEVATGSVLEIAHDDDALMIAAPGEQLPGTVADLLALVEVGRVEELLRDRLEGTGFFGARFRQNAARALLLPKAGFRQRTPLWVHRQRSKKLLEAVRRYGDFPLVLETWRTCLRDEFELEVLEGRLGELASGAIEVREVHTDRPSPFAANLVWKQTNRLMYADDSPDGDGAAKAGSGLRQDLLRELVFSSHLRPRLPRPLVEELREKLQRRAPGYAPRDVEELLDWVRERLIVPADEWAGLMEAIERDHPGIDREALLGATAGRLAWLRPPGATEASVVAFETVPRLEAALGVALDDHLGPGPGLGSGGDDHAPLSATALRTLEAARTLAAGRADLVGGPGSSSEEDADGRDADGIDRLADFLGDWLRLEGPTTPARLEAVFGPGPSPVRPGGEPEPEIPALDAALERLVDDERVVVDEITRDVDGLEVVDTEVLETLLRWVRSSGRPSFEALPAERLPLFLAVQQGLVPRGEGVEDLQERLEALLGWSAPAAEWEQELLPARLEPYHRTWLDTLFAETDLLWVGTGPERLSLVLPSDRELLEERATREADEAPEASGGSPGDDVPDGSDGTVSEEPGLVFPDARGRYTLEDLAEVSRASPEEVSDALWRAAWDGRVTSDRFDVVRRGVLGRFAPPTRSAPSRGRRGSRPTRRRLATARWGGERSPGSWLLLPATEASDLDALERDELAKDRARLLLARYGVVFRELLARELPALAWSKVFRALRLMELSGEVLAGRFFEGTTGLQFASKEAFRRLSEEGLPDDAVVWMGARDPASPAGIAVTGLPDDLPERRAGNHLVLHGERLVVTSRRRGKSLDIRVSPDHPRLVEYLHFLEVFLTRDVAPVSAVTVEEINGEPAPESPYLPFLRRRFDAVVEPGRVRLHRRY